MKPTKLSLFSLTCAASALIGLNTQAGLQVPYTPDADTLHLWHFDDSTANQATANFVTVTDAVATAGITLTNFGIGPNAASSSATAGVPPYTNILLVSQVATANLKGCLNITPGGIGGLAGKAYAMCTTTNGIGGYFTDTTPFRNPTSGAFTFEALVYIQGNVFSASIGSEWEIFCGDSQGEAGSRAWQFRIQPGSAPSLNINFISQTGGSAAPNVNPALPLSGTDALSVSNWYHVAVTYTGNTPTNSDTPCVLRFYWTYFDAFRTNADLLASFTNSTWGTLGGAPIPAVGGSSRRNNGMGNAGAFEGLIDEVRVSDIARSASQMAFVSGGPQNPPSFVTQPLPSTLVGYGKALSVSTLPTGSQPLYSQWQETNAAAGGWTNVPGQTDTALQVNPATFGNAGLYRLVVTNASGSATSHVASVTVGASFSELFNTGMDTNGVADPALANLVDPHYTLAQSADLAHLGPDTIIWDMTTYPVLPSGIFSFVGGASQWIGPQANTYTSSQGQYVYRTAFLIDSVDLSQPTTLKGTWWENTSGSDILLNGVSTGTQSGLTNSQATAANFTITSGFHPGLNTLDFVVPCVNPNGSYPESAVRIELSGIGQAALPAGNPTIAAQPADQAVRDNQIGAGSVATFAAVALGRPPLSYQWFANGVPASGETNRTLTFVSPDSTASPGTSFQLVVSNDSGSVTSRVATLTLTTNHPPVVANYTLTIYSNTSVNFDLDQAFNAATDADGDLLTLSAYDTTTTNSVALTLTGTVLTFTPPADYLGADQFSYTISDSLATTQGFVNLNVVPQAVPSTVKASLAGGHLILTGAGGSPGGSFRMLSTTNLLTPLTDWTSSTGAFDAGGNLAVTNAITSGVPQSFYLIAVP